MWGTWGITGLLNMGLFYVEVMFSKGISLSTLRLHNTFNEVPTLTHTGMHTMYRDMPNTCTHVYTQTVPRNTHTSSILSNAAHYTAHS